MPGDPTPGSLAQKDATTLGNMICRDFLRGVCYRGDNCKFLHSEQHAPMSSNQLPVCRDYQNGTCNRRNCKYAHIYSPSGFYDPLTMTAVPQGNVTRPEQNPQYPKQMNSRNQQLPPPVVAEQQPPPFEEVFKTRAGSNDPLCKDFQNGYCQRGHNCRFRHVTYMPDQQPIYNCDPNVINSNEPPRHYPFSAVNDHNQNEGVSMMYPPNPQNYAPINPAQNPPYPATIPTKRPFIANDPSINNASISNSASTTYNGMQPPPLNGDPSSNMVKEIEMLRRENADLRDELNARRVEIDSLKAEVAHLKFDPRGVNSSVDKMKPMPNKQDNFSHPNPPNSYQKSPTKPMYMQQQHSSYSAGRVINSQYNK